MPRIEKVITSDFNARLRVPDSRYNARKNWHYATGDDQFYEAIASGYSVGTMGRTNAERRAELVWLHRGPMSLRNFVDWRGFIIPGEAVAMCDYPNSSRYG